MGRNGRRGKGPFDSGQRNEQAVVLPSKMLTSIMKTMDMTFERDMGLLNGEHVRTIPEKKVLIELRGHLDKLHNVLDSVTDSNKEVIEKLKLAKEAQIEKLKNQKLTEENDEDKLGPSIDNANEAAVANNAEVNGKPIEEEKADVVASEAEKNEEKSEVESTDAISSNKRPNEDLTDNVSNKRLKPAEDGKSQAEKEDSGVKSATEIDRMENDPSVKNPKSEFVISQTLPAAAAALGIFNEKGLECTGHEYLKKKYSVASYPTNDLKELLPGELPDMDFSCPKPTNQIQYTTFLSSVDGFFREFSDDDIKFLKSKYILTNALQMDRNYDPEVTSYIIPKLGPLYSDIWMKEDESQKIGTSSPPMISDPSSVLPKKSGFDMKDSMLETEDVSCGPLVSRLLSAILKGGHDDMNAISNKDNQTDSFGQTNNEVTLKIEPNTVASLERKDETNLENDDTTQLKQNTNSDPKITEEMNAELGEFNKTLSKVPEGIIPNQPSGGSNNFDIDYPTFEERLKRELKYVGIYMNIPRDENSLTGEDPDWLTGREDDEISAELRELQTSLKSVTKKNEKRKMFLVSHLERSLAWQEYVSILDDLDKQIDQAYIKRIRVPKKKKKHHLSNTMTPSGITSQLAQQNAANSSLKALLDKRQRWINKIGPLFDEPNIMKRIPKESIYKDLDQEEDEEETDVFGQNLNNKSDDLTEE